MPAFPLRATRAAHRLPAFVSQITHTEAARQAASHPGLPAGSAFRLSHGTINARPSLSPSQEQPTVPPFSIRPTTLRLKVPVMQQVGIVASRYLGCAAVYSHVFLQFRG
jgi:hypothetical protein